MEPIEALGWRELDHPRIDAFGAMLSGHLIVSDLPRLHRLQGWRTISLERMPASG
jgi:hypothetical protein